MFFMQNIKKLLNKTEMNLQCIWNFIKWLDTGSRCEMYYNLFLFLEETVDFSTIDQELF
jgi:hypothetical protein